MSRPLRVLDLGLISYSECWELQSQIVSSLGDGTGQETLLLLEHAHTYTCGRRGGRDHILLTPEELREAAVDVLDVDRGGDVTYHGPGQLVAYPIFRLDQPGQVDYPHYVRLLETVLLDTLVEFGVEGCRIDGYSGVWVRTPGGDRKIAAIGVKVDGRGVTSHGIALNVSTDLRYFEGIVPCGISDKGVTSLQALLGAASPLSAAKASFARHFARTFGFSHLNFDQEISQRSLSAAMPA